MLGPVGSGNIDAGSSSACRWLGLYSVMLPVAGSTLPMLPVAASVNQMSPCLSEATPAGLDRGVGISYDENCSLAGSNFIILSALFTPPAPTRGIHRLPLPSIASPDMMPGSASLNC